MCDTSKSRFVRVADLAKYPLGKSVRREPLLSLVLAFCGTCKISNVAGLDKDKYVGLRDSGPILPHPWPVPRARPATFMIDAADRQIPVIEAAPCGQATSKGHNCETPTRKTLVATS